MSGYLQTLSTPITAQTSPERKITLDDEHVAIELATFA